MKNTLIIIFLIATNFFSYGQEKEVSNYKYIIVPQRFSFLKHDDQYQTSSLTKFLLKKNGFTVVLDSEEYPLELNQNPCKGLTAEVVDKSSMFKTEVVIEFKNCYNKVIYTSQKGESRLKEYKKSFQEAIRRAHTSMGNMKYEAINNETVFVANKENVVVSTKKNNVNSPKATIKTIIPVKKKLSSSLESKSATVTNTLYAQPKENGFQLINSKPAVVFLILNTNVKDVFIIKDKNGLLYKKGDFWIAEFYENGQLVEESYQIKF